MKSEGEVRTALFDFLTTLTNILKTVKPLIEEATREELIKHEPKQQPRPKRTINVQVPQRYEDDEVPF